MAKWRNGEMMKWRNINGVLGLGIEDLPSHDPILTYGQTRSVLTILTLFTGLPRYTKHKTYWRTGKN